MHDTEAAHQDMAHQDNGHSGQHRSIEETANRFIGKRQELEIDKLFKALVKLEGERFALEGRAAALCAREGVAAAAVARAD